jgi:type II secretory pathway pseudopilin PulG
MITFLHQSGPSGRRRNRGFTLFEALIALGLAVTLAMFVLQSLAPWLNFRQRMENDRRLQLGRTAIESVYAQNLKNVDTADGAVFTVQDGVEPLVTYASATTTTGGQCTGMNASADTPSAHLVPKAAGSDVADFNLDGYNQPWCFFASNRLELQRSSFGAYLKYHVFALVSAGRDGVLSPGTHFDGAVGTLALGGDDRGVIVDGRALVEKAYEETSAKLAKVTKAYETYFTSRYLANPSRDVTVDYFTGSSDTEGIIGGTGGSFLPALVVLGPLGLSPGDLDTPYGLIWVGNDGECAFSGNGVQCGRAPPSTNLPWTAVLYVNLPGDDMVLSTAVGGY